jgi:hypothetical protein
MDSRWTRTTSSAGINRGWLYAANLGIIASVTEATQAKAQPNCSGSAANFRQRQQYRTSKLTSAATTSLAHVGSRTCKMDGSDRPHPERNTACQTQQRKALEHPENGVKGQSGGRPE